MDIMLIDPAGSAFRFPVNPSEITIKREKNYETVNIINLGDIDFPHGEKVREITFSSFLPIDYDAGYCRYPDIPDPQQAMNQLTAWTAGAKPVRIIITDTIINTLVLLAVHNNTFKGGEPGDIYFDLSLRTWREVRVRTSAEAAPVPGINPSVNRPALKPVPKTYTVKPGDSLYKIAKLELGSASKWQQIYTANAAVIGKKPELIIPGTKLVLP